MQTATRGDSSRNYPRRTNQKLQARTNAATATTKVKAFLDLVTEKENCCGSAGRGGPRARVYCGASTGTGTRRAASFWPSALTHRRSASSAARWLSGAGAKTEPTRDEKRYRARLKKDDERLQGT